MSADQQVTPRTAPPTRKVPVAAGTNLRRGVSNQNNNNVIPPALPKGDYLALAQCTGGFVDEDPRPNTPTNLWWVKIRTAQGDGWVSAVRILEGDNNKPIDHVFPVPTIQAAPTPTGPPGLVPVKVGAILRKGASAENDVDNTIGEPLAEGKYLAHAQCTGGRVDEGPGKRNFWWVYISVPGQGEGWVSAVHVLLDPDNKPITTVPVPQVPTVQGN